MIERKAAYVAQALNGGDASHLEENGEAVVNAREAKAIATGNPLIMEKFTLQDKVGKLKRLRSSFYEEQRTASQKVASAAETIASIKKIISAAKIDAATVEKNKTDDLKIEIGGTVYDKRKEAGAALMSIKRDGKIGSLYGLDIYMNGEGVVYLKGAQEHSGIKLGESPDGNITRILNAAAEPENAVAKFTRSLREREASIEDAHETLKRKFVQQEELDKAVARLLEVDTELGIIQNEVKLDETAVYETDDADVDYAISTESNLDKWNTTRVGGAGKKPMPISDIINKMRHEFGIPIGKGRMPRRDVAGQYDRHSHSVQTRIVNDLPTVAHELGHHLDNVYGITKGLSKELTKELVDNLSDAMKASYPDKKMRTEGFAEFIRRYMQNRETAAIDYPLFTSHLESSVDPKDMELINSFADEINAYCSLDADTAQSSIRDFGEGPRDFRTLGERTSDSADKAYQAWIDSFHGIKLFDRAAGTNTYIGAINSAYADSVAYSVLTRDLTDMDGKRVGGGLQQALNGVNLKDAKEYKAFGEYLIVRHGPERLAEGMRVLPDERKNSTAWMNARQTVLEQQYPEFENAANRLYEFQKNFLQTWGVKTGLVPAESAEQWAERWKYYVPFNRAIAKQSRVGAKRGFANQNSTIRKARRSRFSSGSGMLSKIVGLPYQFQ